MYRQDPQQIIQADRGAKIENVIQIMQGSQDVTFSRSSAHQVPNRIRQENALAVARSELGKYFWRPPDIEDALAADVTVQGWSVPLWRLQGEESATWTVLKREVIGKTQDGKELEQWVPDQRHETRTVDWLVPAHRVTDRALQALSRTADAVNTSQPAVRVDWQGYPFGVMSQIGRELRAKLGILSTANAQALFANPKAEVDLGNEYAGVPVSLTELEPGVSLRTAVDRADRQIEDYAWKSASRSSQKLTNFRHKLDVYSAEQYWFPMWLVQYTYRGSQHAVVINGHSGRPIDAPLPLSFRAGVIAWSIPTLVSMIPFWLLAFWSYETSPGLGFLSLITTLLYVVIPFLMTGVAVLVWGIRRRLSSE